MDCGAPFSPRWNANFNPKNAPVSKDGMNTYTFIQEGGKRYRKKRNTERVAESLQNGGLDLISKNMDCGPPFHPRWNTNIEKSQ